nr:ROK family protein [Paenibacillus phyllosphaerae]
MHVGIDGGGSKTACLVGDEEGNVLACEEGESSNVKSRPREQVEETLLSLIRGTVARAGGAIEDIGSVTLGLAGGHRPADKQRMTDFLKPYLPPSASIQVHNDAETALAAGTWGQAGIVLIAGTGSIAHGYLPERDCGVRVGGWGYLLGDEGSGYDIGRQALMAVTRHADGIDEAAMFSEAVLRHLSIRDPQQLVDRFYESGNARKSIAQLARLVIDMAAQGDETAARIVQQAAQDLSRLAVTARRKMEEAAGGDLKEIPLVLAGGLFGSEFFTEQFMGTIRSRMSGSAVHTLRHPPVIGAYVLGLIQSDVQLAESTIHSILRTWGDTERKIES